MGEIPVSIFPLCLKKVNFISILEFIGEPFNDYNAPLIDESNLNMADALKYITNNVLVSIKYDLLLLNKQKKWVPEELYPYFSAIQHQNKGYSILISSQWIDYYADRFSKKARYNHRRSLGLLEKKGVVLFETDKFLGLYRTLYKLLEFKSFFYKRVHARNQFSSKTEIKKYIQFISNLHEKDYVDVRCLVLNNKMIAIHCGYIYNNVYYYIMPSYDDEYQEFSPGKILMVDLIRNAFGNKIGRFDFTIGDEPYKYQWSNTVIQLFTYAKCRTILGMLYYLYINARIKISKNKVVRKIRALLL